MNFDRIFLVVLDSVGIGELPDADLFHDTGAHTLGHIAERIGGLNVPNLQAMGLGNIAPLMGVKSVAAPQAHYGKMLESAQGKDTTTGHWEMMGIEMKTPFRTYPNGFPERLIQDLSRAIGRGILGNKPASGTEIVEELGELHIKTGDAIVYTSTDSVLQIAAHEDIISLPELYEICRTARELTLKDDYAIGRVIARPFAGEPGSFRRTSHRKDYSVKPPESTVMNALVEQGFESLAIGKISDIYADEGITESLKTASNREGVDRLLECMGRNFTGLCFVNLVDFDSQFGHRRDPIGYGRALAEFDGRLPEVVRKMGDRDLLIITADHGNDPTFRGTDHTREYVPLLIYHRRLTKAANLGIRKTFADIGATVAANFGVSLPTAGTSLLEEID